jgi:hypothetical protein
MLEGLMIKLIVWSRLQKIRFFEKKANYTDPEENNGANVMVDP